MTVGDLVDLLRVSKGQRGPERGRALSLSETATVMYAEGYFDRIPNRRDIAELEASALAKARRALEARR